MPNCRPNFCGEEIFDACAAFCICACAFFFVVFSRRSTYVVSPRRQSLEAFGAKCKVCHGLVESALNDELQIVSVEFRFDEVLWREEVGGQDRSVFFGARFRKERASSIEKPSRERLNRADRQNLSGRTCRYAPWHFLYFLPLPQGQGSLRPTLASVRCTGAGAAADSSPRFSVSLACGRERTGGGAGFVGSAS